MSARNFAGKALLAGVTAFLFCMLPTAGAQSLSQVQLAIGASASSAAEHDPITVVPFAYDPFGTELVQARWLPGIGCPTNAMTNDGMTSGSYTDPACPTGDASDKANEGLLLVKTGPTTNFAAAGASLKGVKGIRLTELGYDIRSGGHCGAGAPRFNVVTTNGTTQTSHFVGCMSPPGVPVSISPSWRRLRWTAAQLAAAFPPILPTDQVVSIDIIFDEGSDVAPDFSGVAILDNVDVNGTLTGKGPAS